MPRLTPTQMVIMETIRDYGDPLSSFRGRAARGGAMRSLHSLERRGLVAHDPCSPYKLTEYGVKALSEEGPMSEVEDK